MLKVASYNVHKCVGLDRRCDPERIMAVLREINADVVALQEADRRFGRRASAIPLALIEQHSPYLAVQLDTRPDSMGWHGNAMLVRKDMAVLRSAIVPLPTLEPRGAISIDLAVGGGAVLRVVGMHLDLSGLRRRHQVRAICAHVAACGGTLPLVMMGDMNEWSAHGGALREFGDGHHVLAPGRSFHTRRPIAMLDRIVVSADVTVQDMGVHHSALSARASDHLPVWARITL